jgi:hypothetical protein
VLCFFLVPETRGIHLCAAIICFLLAEKIAFLPSHNLLPNGKRKKEFETDNEEAGMSAFHQRLAFSGKKVQCFVRREAFIFLLD